MAVNQEDFDGIGQGILAKEMVHQCACHDEDEANSNVSLIDSDISVECDFQIPPQPVCTSTPNLPRVCSQLYNSVVSFLKIDDSGYVSSPSGSAEPMQSSPSVTSEISSMGHLVAESRITSTPILSATISRSGRNLVFCPEGYHRENFTPITDSPACSKTADSKIMCLQANVPDHKGKQFSRRRSSGNEDKLYEICSIWEDDESRDSTDKAYFSGSRHSDFDGSSQPSDLVDSFNHALRHFSPNVPSKLIGRRIGVEKVDIVKDLASYGLDVISLLLPYFQPVDVVRMCLVSPSWRRLCIQHHAASRLRQQYLTAPTAPEDMGKENQVSPGKKRSQKRALTTSSGQLAEIQPLEFAGARASVAPTSVVYSSLYDQTRKSLRWEEQLRHCPKCHSISRVFPSQERGLCLNQQCQADFCTQCFASYHDPNMCAPILVKKSKTDSVGSKKSRKNLKRL